MEKRISNSIKRRTVLGLGAGTVGLFAAGSLAWSTEGKIGKFRQGSNMGPYIKRKNKKKKGDNKKKLTLDQFCIEAKKIGLVGFDLCDIKQWPTLKKHGLICSMTKSHGLGKGLNNPELHEKFLKQIRDSIDKTSAEGWPNVITFSGNRRGMDDEVGLKNSVKALKEIAPYAEKKNVTVCLELLNSIKNHKDYMADSTKWCVELVHRVGSDRVKVLYDIYHAGMMGEDIISDIKKHHDCWGHYHTAGIPGRHEIDASQKLDYKAIMTAIAETGYTGMVVHEFRPKGDPMTSLRQAFEICNV